MQKKLKWMLFATSFCSLISCAPKPPNVFVYEHMSQRLYTDPTTGHQMLEPSPTCMKQIGEPECGHGISIISGDESFLGEKEPHLLNGKPWSQVRRESVYLPAQESYAPLSQYIINSCAKMGCSSDVDGFKVKLDSLKSIIQAH